MKIKAKCAKLTVSMILSAVFIVLSGIPVFADDKPPASRFADTGRYGLEALKNGASVSVTEINNNADASGFTFIQSCKDYGQELTAQNPYGFALNRFTYSKGSDYVTYSFITYADRKTLLDTAEAADNKADEIIKEIITDKMSDYQKARAIYKYVKNAATYDYKAAKLIRSENWRKTASQWGYAASAYGCLINGKAVCEGYSKAFTLLARKAGLSTVIIYGRYGNTDHQWNRVWCYDKSLSAYTVYDVDFNEGIFCSTYAKWKERSSARYTDRASINSLVGEDLSGRFIKYTLNLKGEGTSTYIVNKQ